MEKPAEKGGYVVQTNLPGDGDKADEVYRFQPNHPCKSGRIGLQSHTDRVEFRRIRVKEFKPAPSGP